MEPKLTFSQWVAKLSKRYYYKVLYTRHNGDLLGYKIIETKEQNRSVAVRVFESTYPDLIWASTAEVDESWKGRDITFDINNY